MPNISTVRIAAILGIGISLFALSLFVIRLPLRTITIFFAIGAALTILWLWAEARQNRNNEKKEPRTGPVCVCSTCKHQDQQDCYHDECACCVIKEGDRIVGHRPHPLA